jgi:hypothetical protein
MSALVCGCCGKGFDDFPLDVGYARPGAYVALAPNERGGCSFSDDVGHICRPDAPKRCFVRCLLVVPITGSERHFGWGFWAEVRAVDFKPYVIRVARSQRGLLIGTYPTTSFAGTINVEPVSGYDGLSGAPVLVEDWDAKQRPRLHLREGFTPGAELLAREQRDGIPIERAHAIVKTLFGERFN